MSSLAAAVDDLLDNRQPSVEEAVDRHFAPSLRQRVDGTPVDRHGFVSAIEDLRDKVERADVAVLDELAGGDRYAERHTLDLLLGDGSHDHREVLVFARRQPDGRISELDEATLQLSL